MMALRALLFQAGARNSEPPEPISRLVPASSTVPAAATDHQENHDDDQKCRRVHTALLEMIMGRRASRPDGCQLGDSMSAPYARCHLPTLRPPPSLCNIDHTNVVSWTGSGAKRQCIRERPDRRGRTAIQRWLSLDRCLIPQAPFPTRNKLTTGRS
jgi:hypothetical protein